MQMQCVYSVVDASVRGRPAHGCRAASAGRSERRRKAARPTPGSGPPPARATVCAASMAAARYAHTCAQYTYFPYTSMYCNNLLYRSCNNENAIKTIMPTVAVVYGCTMFL